MAMTPQEAYAAGLAWVDENHPNYGKAGYAGYTGGPASGPSAYVAPDLAPAAAGTVEQQSKNAQLYSQSPGAAPTANTTNQGTQDVVRNSYLQQATQGTTVDRNDPNFRQQVEPFAAAQERARRDYVTNEAEQLSAKGLGDSGALRNEQRLASEHAAQATGSFESALVGKELQNRRDEVQSSLTNLKGMINADQAAALQRELADLDAALKREGLAQSGSLGSADIALRDKLGTGQLNGELLRTLLTNQQFGQGQALQWSQFDWDTSPMNPRNW